MITAPHERRCPLASAQPRLYTDLASWWPLLSGPEEYDTEAEFVGQLLRESCSVPPREVLELGSGGGNMASHLKAAFEMTLVDLSAEMLNVSRALNPECEHLEGDMRSVRLGRLFDAVFVHDAICYMTTEADLKAALATAHVHCREQGSAVFEPDHVRDSFAPTTDHGGHDGADRSLRYLEWTYDPDLTDTVYTVDYAYLLRNADGSVEAVHDRHEEGLFSRSDWLTMMREVSFEPRVVRDPWGRDVFVGAKERG